MLTERLDELHTEYSADRGSDHWTKVYARVEAPNGNFDEHGVQQWLDQLEEVQAYGDAKLSVTRDHL